MAVCKGAKALRARRTSALGLHRRLGSDTSGVAWLFPKIKLVLCFLHSILKIKKHCAGQLRHQVLDRAWQVYQAATKRQFSQRLRRVAEWTPLHLSGPVATMVLKMCRHRIDFTPAYDRPQAHRTSNASIGCSTIKTDCSTPCAIARTTDSARWPYGHGAAMELSPLWCTPAADQPSRVSPFHDLNGFQYHPNCCITSYCVLTEV